MRLLIIASTAFLLFCGSESCLQSAGASTCSPLHPHVPIGRSLLTVVTEGDTDSQIQQVPTNRLGPPGNRIPEVGPPPPKAQGTEPPAKPNTANCTGANANSPECYSATQQGKAK
jgi:hypothetical protein